LDGEGKTELHDKDRKGSDGSAMLSANA